jgi:hypothetical protein
MFDLSEQSNTWEKATVTLTADTSGTWVNTSAGSMLLQFALHSFGTTSTGSWVAGNKTSTSNQVNNLDSTSNYFRITGVQLELGSVATDFEFRSYGEELALCERYYQLNIANTGYTNSSTSCRLSIAGKTTMRATPTLAIVNGTGTCEDYGAANRNITGLGSLSGGTVHGGLADATIASSTSGKSHALFSGAIAMIAEL